MTEPLSNPTMATLLAAGLIFLLALALGTWKYRQMATSDDHLAHPYLDIAHRSALLYSFDLTGVHDSAESPRRNLLRRPAATARLETGSLPYRLGVREPARGFRNLGRGPQPELN